VAESELIQTGVYGLDPIFLGGILRGNVILVEGAVGTGKTLMGLEFIYPGDHGVSGAWHHRGV